MGVKEYKEKNESLGARSWTEFTHTHLITSLSKGRCEHPQFTEGKLNAVAEKEGALGECLISWCPAGVATSRDCRAEDLAAS